MPEVVALLLGALLLAVFWLYLCLKKIDGTVMGSDGEKAEERPNTTWCSCIPIVGLALRVIKRVEQLKQSTRESEARYKVLTDNVAAAVIMHTLDGTVLWCSPYTEVLTGYSLSEIYGDRCQFLTAHVHEEDRESIRQALAIVASGEPFQCRYRFFHKSGLSLWLETRTVPVVDQPQQEGVALSIILDVTASVHGQLKVEQRNRDLNEFTYMVSHDLKAPIVTLRGMLEVVREESESRTIEGLSEPIEHMGKAINRLEKLVEGVLELARVSTTERELIPVSLGEVIADVVDDYQWQITQVGAHVTVAGGLPWVVGNKTQLYQVFGNLLGNALKYRDPARPACISIKASEISSRRRAIVEVIDNGRGIAPEFHESIFTPFARAGETVIEGSGVGLASVKRILEKLGGTITVTSTVGQGSTFTVDLRRAVNAEKTPTV
jgi:PAS domain S-box-containing protein